MEETDDNMSADDVMMGSPSSLKVKPKKRSLVERELETSLTARVTSPVTDTNTSSTSRYGRARRLKTDPEYMDLEKALKQMKSPVCESNPMKVQSPVYKMHASNSPIKMEPKETPMKGISPDSSLDDQIENIYHENISLSRFGSEEKKNKSSGSKHPKVYVRTDLIQKREKDDTVVLIKNVFSPVQSPYKSTNSHLNNILERSSEKYHLNTVSKSPNGYMNTLSVVKTLDFDSKKKIKTENKDNKVMSKSDLFDMEAKCDYQVGDLAWARMGTYPFWPCIVTREPSTGMFVKKKLFGRIERDVIHVTFFGDNGRRGWIVDTMLRKFLGQLEFEATREKFSPSAKKRDPRLYAAFFISEKKMPQWSISVEEAEMLLREPKRLRIDLLNDMLAKPKMIIKSASKSQKSGKITRTGSDVSLSESLYDTLFYEDDGKTEDPERSRSKSRKSLDVSEVVTACLDNMAAKTGITKIQKQSHMDRWLQKAKSKTPEKLQAKVTPQKKEKEVKVVSSKKKKKVSPVVSTHKPYSLRRMGNESHNLKSHHNEHDYSSKVNDTLQKDNVTVAGYAIDVVAKVESLSDDLCTEDIKETQLTNENVVTNISEDLTKSFGNDGKEESATLGPITADDTVDEIQVNICSIEENAELEGCMQSVQKEVKTTKIKVDKNETTKHKGKKTENVINKVDSIKHTESKKMDIDQPTCMGESNELFKSNIESDKCVESAKTVLDQIESKQLDLEEEIRSLEAVLQEKCPDDLVTQSNDENKHVTIEKEADIMQVDPKGVSAKGNLVRSNVVEYLSPQTRSTKPTISRKLRVTRHTRNTAISESMEVVTEDSSKEIAKNDSNVDAKVPPEITDINSLKLNKNVEDTAYKYKENKQLFNKELEAKQKVSKNVILIPICSDSLVNGTNVVDDLTPQKRSTRSINLRLKRHTKNSPNTPDKMKVHLDNVSKETTTKDSKADIPPETTDINPVKLKEDVKVDTISFKDNAQVLNNELQTQDDSNNLLKCPLNSSDIVKSITVKDQITQQQSPKPIINRKTRLTRHTRDTPISAESMDVDSKNASKEIPTNDSQPVITSEKADINSVILKENMDLHSTTSKDNVQVFKDTLETIKDDSQDLIRSPPFSLENLVKSTSVEERSPHKRYSKPIINRKLRLTRNGKNTSISTESMEVDSEVALKEIPITDSEAEVVSEKTYINSVKHKENIELQSTTSNHNMQVLKNTRETKEGDSKTVIKSPRSSLDNLVVSTTVKEQSPQKLSPKPIINRKLRLTRHTKSTSISTENEDIPKELPTKESQPEITSENTDIDSVILKENEESDTTKFKDNVLKNELEIITDESKNLVISPQIVKSTNEADDQSPQKRSTKPIICRKLSVKRHTRSSPISTDGKLIDDKVEAKNHKKTVKLSVENGNKESIQLPSTNKKEEILDESQKQQRVPQIFDFKPTENEPIVKIISENTQSNSEVILKQKIAPIDNDVKISETIQQTHMENDSLLKIVEKIPDSMREQDDGVKSIEVITQNNTETTLHQENNTQNTENVIVHHPDLIIELQNTIKHTEQNTQCHKIDLDGLIESTLDLTAQSNDILRTTTQENSTQNIECVTMRPPESTEPLHNERKQDDNVQNVEIVSRKPLVYSPQSLNVTEIIQDKLDSTQAKPKESTPVSTKHVENQSDDDMEYGHLQFTENRTNEIHQPQLVECAQISQTQATLVLPKETPTSNMELEDEDKEYGHLDFIFSSFGEKFTESYKDITKDGILLENHKTISNSLLDQEANKITDNLESGSEARKKVASLGTKEECIINTIRMNSPKQRELRVSVEKLPLSSLHISAFISSCKESKENGLNKGIEHGNHFLKSNSEDTSKILNDKVKNTEHTLQEVKLNGDNVVSKMSVDEELDAKTKTHDSEKLINVNYRASLINEIDSEMNNEVLKCPMAENNVSAVDPEKKVEVEKCPEQVDMRLNLADNTKDSKSISTEIINVNNKTDQCTNIVSEFETVSKASINDCKASINDCKASENLDKVSDDVSNVNNIDGIIKDPDTFALSLNRLPQPVKLNGFHVDECIDFSDGEFNVETSSINSEDSEPLSVTKSKLLSKNRSKAKKALDNTEFIKYCELRQDMLIDEHPELSQDEIVEYLYKTWEYEETTKHDLVKSDDIEQSSLVKGLNSNLRQKTITNNHRASKKRNKKREEDTYSINSDVSDTSVKRKLRTRAAKSPTISIEDCEGSIEIKTELLESLSVNSDVSHNSVKEVPTIPDNKVEPPVINKENLPQPVTSSQVDEKCTDYEENKEKSVEIKKEKMKSPKSKQNSLKNYFKHTNQMNGSNINHEDEQNAMIAETRIKKEYDPETASMNSEDSEVSVSKKKRKYGDKNKSITDPEFLKYVELRQDHLIDENPQLTEDEITAYLYKTWLYEENAKSDIKKTEELETASLVKGLNDNVPQPKKIKKKIKVEKDFNLDVEVLPKEKPKRKTSQPYYNEDLSDIEDEIELFEIFKKFPTSDGQVKTDGENVVQEDQVIELDDVDEVELYFSQLTEPKPNVFKGLVRERVCDICERTGNLVKCKGCHCMFHVDCVTKAMEVVETPAAPTRGRKKKKRLGRKPKNLEDSESHSDDKSQDMSEELNASIEDEMEPRTVNADDFEAALEAKMQELVPTIDMTYDSDSSVEILDWRGTAPGKCVIVDVKLKPKIVTDYSNFKCNNCQVYESPVCFVCKGAVSKTGTEQRQKCQTAHCNKYYHLECLDHWPQTQFEAGEPSKSNNKKINEHFEALMCPRHVCHTCVSDDPRGCKTRFSGDKLARCVRCPATYHSFTKCLPAGSQILTGSLIVCPRHYEHRPGKVPYHVNTGWCFICALGGSLICCEYCPTSFHAECLNILPPEGGYMCEDCETGRLPLYGEMVWVKLGHYRWWPGIILHPCEIPENILAVKHSPGEFVVRFFGQYDHYWVNRGRVFPFQEGDSGNISSQKSKIDAAFTTAMEHAQRACEIMKNAKPNEEESQDIASSLLPPRYVKLRVNKPRGCVAPRREPESSLTQCDCAAAEPEPCGPHSHCLNRMLLTECGPSCRTGDRCNNRAFEKRQYPNMTPYRTPHRGWGLKTLEDIKAGQFVIEYVGELIDNEEFMRRMNRKHEIRDENFYFLTLDKERMIDAGPKGNLARFMNHCCEPNCETQKWTVLGDVRVGLFALYDIPANSELTFNYNLECAGIEKKRCMCGARRCSGYIGAKPKQEEVQPKKAKRTYKKRKNVEVSPSTSKPKPKRPVGRPAKPRELTEIEKDLLIIKNATNGISSDSEGSGRLSSFDSERCPKALKRKRVSFSTEDSASKKAKVEEKNSEADCLDT